MALFYQGTWILLLLTLSLILAEGGKILVVPQDGSHWLSMRPVVEKLQQKGHEIVVLVPSTSLYMKSEEHQNYTVQAYPIPYTEEYLGEKLKAFVHAHFLEQSVWNVVLTSYQSTIEISSVFFTNCKSLLQNEELMQHLKESKFDLIFTDPILMCGPLVAEYLALPSVYFLRGFPCGMDSAATQCPSPPSYVPRLFLDNSDSMTFSQRVKNMLVDLLELFYCKPIYDNFEELAYEVLKKKVTVTELLSRGSFWLMRYDFVFEFPRPVMPNMAFIGGINCVQKKKLSEAGKETPHGFRRVGLGDRHRPTALRGPPLPPPGRERRARLCRHRGGSPGSGDGSEEPHGGHVVRGSRQLPAAILKAAMLGWRRGDSRGLCAVVPGPGPGQGRAARLVVEGPPRAATAAPHGHSAVPEAVLKRCSAGFCAVPAGPWRSIFFLGLSVVEPRVGSHCCSSFRGIPREFPGPP
ncbi:UDP-glucuronosyltransferase 1-6-like [Melospiza melodia melodia]|uniref:UDP-glucuronosyltransferase 1-6-like n=1 Tax=Melospiza melodia melodia TaxID=1914991 RepID=UPI002FD180D5